MPVQESPNTVTVGTICHGCGLFATQSCPYGNHKRRDTLEYKGDIRGKCVYFQIISEAKKKSFNKISALKEAEKSMKKTQLNMKLFKKIKKANPSERKKLFEYWSILFPEEYADEMTDNINKSKAKNIIPIKKEQKNG